RGQTKTTHEYWQAIEWKTAAGCAAASLMGSMMGTQRVELREACRVFGLHYGFTMQLLNDLESIAEGGDLTDVHTGNVSLPVLYAATVAHPRREEIAALLDTGKVAEHADQILEVLSELDVNSLMIWAGLQERRSAIQAIAVCPDPEGREALTSLLTGMFGDIDDFLQSSE